jgi:hypothetical protein
MFLVCSSRPLTPPIGDITSSQKRISLFPDNGSMLVSLFMAAQNALPRVPRGE